MSALVSVCCATGALRRYERTGERTSATPPLRLTHECIPEDWGTGWEWDKRDIGIMRSSPPTAYAIHEETHELSPLDPSDPPPARVA